jgi:hypothetical protein
MSLVKVLRRLKSAVVETKSQERVGGEVISIDRSMNVTIGSRRIKGSDVRYIVFPESFDLDAVLREAEEVRLSRKKENEKKAGGRGTGGRSKHKESRRVERCIQRGQKTRQGNEGGSKRAKLEGSAHELDHGAEVRTQDRPGHPEGKKRCGEVRKDDLV